MGVKSKDRVERKQSFSFKYRFESCTDYYGLVSTIQRIEEVQIVRWRNWLTYEALKGWDAITMVEHNTYLKITGSNPVLTTKIKVMKDYYKDNKEYYLWCIENNVIPYY